MEIKEILEKIALPARSNKHGFQNVEKLQAIESLLSAEGSPFHIIEKNEHTWIFGMKSPERGELPFLISTHADIVDGIKHPSSTLGEDRYYHGTYDNLGTNAACVALMLNEELPDNIYIAFNDEEETGRCLGAARALSFLTKVTGNEPVCVALDVTDEGYDNDRLFTIEGMHSKSDAVRERMLKAILSGEGEKQSFEVVKMKKKDDVSMLPEGYVAKGLTVFDESVFYAEAGCNSFSMCLPTDGSMHSDSGLYVKEPVMEGYIQSLLQITYILNAVYPDKVKAIAEKKDSFVTDAENIAFRKSSYSYGGYSGYSSTGYAGKEWKDFVSTIHSRSKSPYSYLHDEYDDDDETMSAYEAERYYDLGDFLYESFMDVVDREVMSVEDLIECYMSAENYSQEEFDEFFQDMCDIRGMNPENQEIYDVVADIYCYRSDEIYQEMLEYSDAEEDDEYSFEETDSEDSPEENLDNYTEDFDDFD